MRTVFAPHMYVDGEPGKSVRIIDERRGHSHVRVERADLGSLITALEARRRPAGMPRTAEAIEPCSACGRPTLFTRNDTGTRCCDCPKVTP